MTLPSAHTGDELVVQNASEIPATTYLVSIDDSSPRSLLHGTVVRLENLTAFFMRAHGLEKQYPEGYVEKLDPDRHANHIAIAFYETGEVVTIDRLPLGTIMTIIAVPETTPDFLEPSYQPLEQDVPDADMDFWNVLEA